MNEANCRGQKLPQLQFQVRDMLIIRSFLVKNIWSFSSNFGSKSYARLKVPCVSTKVLDKIKLIIDLWLNILSVWI